jgi:tRNA dimethylallyltransferase
MGGGPHRQELARAAASEVPAVVVIAGPTASGKSGLALALAERLEGTVVNADSMQLYRELAVLSARPDAASFARAPHRLYGVLDAAERCSAVRWRAMAEAAIDEAHAAGHLPILIGGTGLYLKALMTGLADIPPVPEPTRAALAKRLGALGAPALHAELAALDPPTAARLEPNDRQRILRALGVLQATGRPLSDWLATEPAAPGPGRRRYLAYVLDPPRSALYAATDARLAAMVEAGALDEVAALLARGLDPGLPAMKAIGVPEFGRHLAGKCDLATALAAAQQATRRYAKRQLTWFRNQLPEASRLVENPNGEQFMERFFHEIFAKICRL